MQKKYTNYVETDFSKKSEKQVEEGRGGGILVQYKPAQSEMCIMYILTRFFKLMIDGADLISSGSMLVAYNSLMISGFPVQSIVAAAL